MNRRYLDWEQREGRSDGRHEQSGGPSSGCDDGFWFLAVARSGHRGGCDGRLTVEASEWMHGHQSVPQPQPLRKAGVCNNALIWATLVRAEEYRVWRSISHRLEVKIGRRRQQLDVCTSTRERLGEADRILKHKVGTSQCYGRVELARKTVVL